MSASDATTCIVCSRQMENIMAGRGVQPNGGLAFSSGGHYGSTVFDPMDGSMLELCICDECLVAAGKKGQVTEHPQVMKPSPKRKRWQPDDPQ